MRSTRIVGIQDTNYVGVGWHWLSRDTLLTDRRVADSGAELVRINIRRKSIERLTAANQRFLPLSKIPPSGLYWYSVCVSPDGRWLLFYNLNVPDLDDPVHHQAFAMSLDGKQHIAFYLENVDAVVAWLSDSRSWIEVRPQADKIVTHTLKQPKTSTSQALILLPMIPGAYNVRPLTVAGVAAPDRLVLQTQVSAADGRGDLLAFYTFDMRAKALVARFAAFERPAGVDITDVHLSPDGKSLAWRFFVEDEQVYAAYRQRKGLPTFLSLDMNMEVWTSTLEGTEWGQIKIDSPDKVLSLLWSPDSKRLFYTGQTSLWSVPVN